LPFYVGRQLMTKTGFLKQDYGEGEMKMALKFHLVVVQLIKKKVVLNKSFHSIFENLLSQ
jgi:hypothetical protein